MNLSGISEPLSEVGEPPKKVCAVCQSPADKSCGACRGINYCSVEHQKSHWKEHKKDCPPIRIVTSPELGPHFVATRDLPPWTLLLTELPVLINPIVIHDYHPPSCISCRSILPFEPWPCFQCLTPFFCNLSCSMNKIHSEFECGVLSKCSEEQRNKICIQPNLMYLRAISLKNNDPETWNKFLEIRGANQYKTKDEDENAKWFIREILPIVGEKGVGFEKDLAKLLDISLQLEIVKDLEGFNPGEDHGETGLHFLEASNFAQNCYPNCTQIIGKYPQCQLQLRTTIEIKKGQILSIDFLGPSHSHCVGAIFRQHMMNIINCPLCICPRCSDPTELGTMQSAVKCTQRNCKEGYLLPIDPMNLMKNAIWRCNRSECKGKSTWEEIEKITYAFERRIVTFKEQVPVADVERTREFWEILGKNLHPNHYIVRNFKKDLVRELNSQMMYQGLKFSLPRMDLHITMIEHLLKMAHLINPGLSLTQASLLVLLFNGLNHRLLWSEVRHRAEQKELMERALNVIDQLMPFSKYYPEVVTPDIQHEMEKRKMLQWN